MIYELRIYRCVPGRKPALLSRFENETLRTAHQGRMPWQSTPHPPHAASITSV
jgi:hypothetical protein